METEEKSIRISWIILAVSMCFMWFIFAPLDAYFANIEEYWFSFHDIMPVVLVSFLIALAVMATVFLLINLTHLRLVAFSLITSFLVFFYIQGNYIPRNYGVLNGFEIDWAQYTNLGMASIDLGIVCLVLFIIGLIKFKEKMFEIGKYIALFLIIIQVVTLSVTYIQKVVLANKGNKNNIVVTDKDLLTLSENGDNIVVFLLDTFDVEYMDRIIEENPGKYEEILEDFTWYKDTLSAYPTTKGAIPQILSGIWYENDVPFDDYVAAAYKQSALCKEFKERGYTFDIYTESIFLNKEEGFYNNVIKDSYHLSDHVGFARDLYKLIAFYYMPHQLKKNFFIDTASFDKYKTVSLDDKAYSENTQNFFNTVNEIGFTKTDRGNLFKFYHLDGVHGPFTFGESFKDQEPENYTAETEAKGNMTLLKLVFDQMKAIDVYNSSTIILLADHGHINYSQNPIFMIKNRNESHAFDIADSEMSYEFLPSIFSELSQGHSVGTDFIDALKPENGKRRFLYYSWDNAWDKNYLPGMDEMFSEGKAWDPKSLKSSGRKFIPQEEAKNYKVGDTLSFKAEGNTAQPYCVYGVSWTQPEGTWTDGTESAMRMKLNGKYENLKLSFTAKPFYHEQYVKIIANNNEVGSLVVNDEGNYDLIIPHDYITDNELTLQFQFSTPVHVPTALMLATDERYVALFLKSMTLSSTDQGFDIGNQQAIEPKDYGTIFFYPSELSTQGIKEEGRILLAKGQLQYGPYIALKEGMWQVYVEGNNLETASYHVTADCGKTTIPVYLIEQKNDHLIYYFEIDKEMESVEFLVGCPDDTTISINRVLLSKSDEEMKVQYKDKTIFCATDLLSEGILVDDRIELSGGQKQYGPYIPLQAGIWEVRVDGEGLDKAKYYATANSGVDVLPIETISVASNCIVYRLKLEEDMKDVEFLVCGLGNTPVYVDSVTLSSADN